jgi:hypothetical protein
MAEGTEVESDSSAAVDADREADRPPAALKELEPRCHFNSECWPLSLSSGVR